MDPMFRQDMVSEWECVSPSIDFLAETEEVSVVPVTWVIICQKNEDELDMCNASSNEINICSFMEI